jgi:hypothetical protein
VDRAYGTRRHDRRRHELGWQHIDGMSEAGVPLLTGLRPQPGEPVVGRVASAPTRQTAVCARVQRGVACLVEGIM